jgi:hypothetical protein
MPYCLKYQNSFDFLFCRHTLQLFWFMSTNGLRHPPAVPAVMQVFEALRLVWRAAAVGGLLVGYAMDGITL